MKAILLENYKINARAIAEAMWGTGGTQSTKTNRKGAYYFSCSGHGGYVVNSSCLTEDEKNLLQEYLKPEQIQVLIQHRTDGDYVIGVSLSAIQAVITRNKKLKYFPSLGTVEWKNLDVYVFEEDCDWAILEKLTDIRANCCSSITDEQRQEEIDRTFNRWAKTQTEKIGNL